MDDLISRQDAIDAIMGVSIPLIVFGKTAKIYLNVKQDAVRQIEAIPSADRPIGEWIEVNHVVDTSCECSECHHRDYILNVETGTDRYECIDRYWFERKFCPNCGADMRGENK